MIFIRADANEKIGTGHVMRCLSIARAFAKRRKVVFVTADHRSDYLVHQAGFKTICLNSNWSDMNGEAIEELIIGRKPDLVLVDSYYVTEEYFSRISPIVPIAYLDDLNTARWNIDFLINYNIFANLTDYSRYKGSQTKLILGPMFAPLRSEFQGLPNHIIKKNVTDVFVSAGGSDPEGITEKLMRYISPSFPALTFHFIVGALNPRLNEIKSMEGGNIILHIHETHMSELMMKCDIAISAAGSTLYELCAAGTPTITYTLADNQIFAAEQFEKQGLMLNAGESRNEDTFIDLILHKMKVLAGDTDMRRSLSLRMQEIVDGNGADRIMKELFVEE